MSDIGESTSRDLVELASPGPLARPGEAAAPLIREVRGTLVLGLSALALFFVIGGIWAATAPLSGAVIALGIVSPESSRRYLAADGPHHLGGRFSLLDLHMALWVNYGLAAPRELAEEFPAVGECFARVMARPKAGPLLDDVIAKLAAWQTTKDRSSGA